MLTLIVARRDTVRLAFTHVEFNPEHAAHIQFTLSRTGLNSPVVKAGKIVYKDP
jgi:hypothetical protein